MCKADLSGRQSPENNVIEQRPDVATRMCAAWIEYLESHNANEARIRPFKEPIDEVHTPAGDQLFAFRDDLGQWIAYPTEPEARQSACREDAPGSQRTVEQITFGALLEDNPKNLIHMYGQYYWAQDLA